MQPKPNTKKIKAKQAKEGTTADIIVEHLKAYIMTNTKMGKIKRKPLQGQFIRNVDQPDIDKQTSLAWLQKAGLKGDTQSLIIAAQDQALIMRYCKKNIYSNSL